MALGYADGTLTYELKIPRSATPDFPSGIAVDQAKPLTIGLETGDYAEAMRNRAGAAGAPSGGGGGRGGRGGGGASGMPGTDMPEALKHWITVHLQAAGSTTAK